MKRLILFGVVMLMLFPLMSSALVVGLNDDVHFDYPGEANDFHIEGVIYSAGGVTPTVTNIIVFGDPGTGNWVVTQYGLIPDGPGRWKFYAHFETDGRIVFCQWIHFGIIFDVEAKNIIADLEGWWTLDGVPLVNLLGEKRQVPVTGFDVSGVGVDETLTVTNDTNIPVVVNQLELTVTNWQIPLEDMFIYGLGRPNEISPKFPNLVWHDVPGLPLTLQPGQFFQVKLIDVGITMVPGKFLQMRGEQYMPGTKGMLVGAGINLIQTTSDWGWFWEQHGE